MIFDTATIVGNSFVGKALAQRLERADIETNVVGSSNELSSCGELLIWCADHPHDYLNDHAETIYDHTYRLAELIKKIEYKKVIYISSTRLNAEQNTVSGEGDSTPFGNLAGSQLFCLSKALGEWLVLQQKGKSHVVRLSTVYSDALDGGSFLESMIQAALYGKKGVFDIAGDTQRDYIHLEDVCEAICAVAEKGERTVYNVASGELVSNAKIFELLKERTGACMQPVELGGACEYTSQRIDISPLNTEILVFPRPLVEGLDRVLTWQDNQRAMRSMMGVTQMPWM